MKSKKATKPLAVKSGEFQFSPALKKLIGCAKLPPDFDYKKDLMEEMYKKYMK